VSVGIALLGPEGRSVQIGVRTELGKALVRQYRVPVRADTARPVSTSTLEVAAQAR
jgi:hypothetical protein